MKKTVLIYASIIVLISVVFTYIYKHQTKTASVNIAMVYANFDAKNELERKFMLKKNAYSKELDSLELNIRILSGKSVDKSKAGINPGEYLDNLKKDFLRKKEEYTTAIDKLQKDYNTQILAQLNQYISEYGVKNQYTYIFGNDGNGSLMYADSAGDISKDLIVFINKKYKGEE